MPQLFELFGYPLEDRSAEAERCRRHVRCPFMDAECDGGGNRYLSNIPLNQVPDLAKFFPHRQVVPSGVCSIQLRPEEPPWIVCPRRLLTLGKKDIPNRSRQRFAESLLMRKANYASETHLGVWPEVKVKYTGVRKGREKHFDYTFDYILMPLSQFHRDRLEALLGVPWERLRGTLERAGYVLARTGLDEFVEGFPNGLPTIVEIMTSSTSGGNRRKRTTIPMAFEDALLGRPHNAPSINYRQVWARMVSQLIVKSEVGLGWGGRTFWILQDVLVDYISSTTGLDIRAFAAETSSEVNILCFSYGDSFRSPKGIMQLNTGKLYAGPICAVETKDPSFQDMVRAPIVPPLARLLELLAKRAPIGEITLP